MNAESTVFRAARPAVVAPGGEGARAAAWVLALPMRLAATPIGRRLLVAVTLAVLAVGTVGYLYDSVDRPRVAASFRAAGLPTSVPAAPAAPRRTVAPPVRARPAPTAAAAAAAWFAARQRVAVDAVRALQQRRVSRTEAQVLVVAERAGSMPSEYVTVRKGPNGWRVP
jgi:hypothetical protein